MADQIQLDNLTGRTIYAIARATSGQVWNGTGFEAYTVANLANYKITLTEQGASGYYGGNVPGLPAGVYDIIGKYQSGASPSINDVTVATGSLNWDGTAIIVPTKVGYALSATGLNSVLIAGMTLPTAIRYIGATTAGKLPSGAGSGTETWQDFAGVNAVSFTVDASGNRTAVVYS
jgi:hypothetical protein